MTSLPERIAKKTLVASIVALHGNGCKEASHCLTVDLQRARHNINRVMTNRSVMTETAFMIVYKWC
jgi:hypothetical protein